MKPELLAMQKCVAVLDFTDAPGADAGHSGKVVAGVISRHLLSFKQWKVIERGKIDQVLKEQDLQHSGRVDPQTAARIGRLLGADGVVIGEVAQYRIGSIPFLFLVTWDQDVYKVAYGFRLVNVETGEICLAASAARESTVSFEDAVSKSAFEVFTEVRSALPGTGQRKPPTPPPLPPRPPPTTLGSRWAVVIGISEYKHDTKRIPDLEFAHRDAEQLAAFLKSKAGGGFADDKVKLLTNEKATAVEIRKALFEFLKRTVKEDLVVIFLSGHGVPDPDKPSNLYLMAHDSNPAQIAATGIPMWDIETALKRTIAADRVVVLADTCHSAGVTEGIRGVKVSQRFNSYFDELAKAKPGRVFLTSCEGYEVSREDKKWGGGHGVFTWALLEGLKGKADRDKDGFVRLGEMIDYVDITVRRETANEQHPTKAGVQFDRNLPMGIVSGQD